jgi:hypothetical protein
MSSTHNTTSPTIAAKPKDQRVIAFAISALVVLVDRVTKHLVAKQLPNGQAHTVIPGVFRITDVHNTGAAFSMFAENASPQTVRDLLIGFSVVAVLVLFARPLPLAGLQRRGQLYCDRSLPAGDRNLPAATRERNTWIITLFGSAAIETADLFSEWGGLAFPCLSA